MRHKVTTELRYPGLWRGCVGAWNPSSGPTGSTLRDWSRFGRHATLTNMDVASDWVTSGGRYALDFDGSNDYVAVPSSAIMTYPATVCFWVLSKSFVAFQGLFNTTAGTSGFSALMGVTGRPYCYCNGTLLQPTPYTLVLNQWYHLAYTLAAGDRRIFVDGKLYGSDAGTVPASSSAVEAIGAYVGLFYTNGQIDDVFVHNRVLSSQEIRTLASRRGIAYELAPRRRSSVAVAGGFNAAWIPRRSLVIGGGTN